MSKDQRATVIDVAGQPFESSIEHFSFALWHKIDDMEELRRLASFPKLRSANLCETGLDDVGLGYVAQATTIEILDLQNTKITNQGLSVLEGLPVLRYLRLKENRQLSNDCVRHLLKLKSLAELQIHETSIDQDGLNQLAVMDNLRDVCLYVQDDNYSFDGLLELSRRMPRCRILAKGRGEFHQGTFQGDWSR